MPYIVVYEEKCNCTFALRQDLFKITCPFAKNANIKVGDTTLNYLCYQPSSCFVLYLSPALLSLCLPLNLLKNHPPITPPTPITAAVTPTNPFTAGPNPFHASVICSWRL